MCICTILYFSCKQKNNYKNENIEITPDLDTDSSYVETKEDTILEKNNPKYLDFSKHQMFIDTTRNSRFFKEFSNWEKSKWDIESINSAIKYHNKNFKPKTIELKRFPNKFISLRKLNGEFILYSRCNGKDSRYEITQNAFIFLGPLESDAESISKILINKEDRIKIELKTYEQKSSDKKSILEIEKLDSLIYKLTYSNLNFSYIDYLTTIDEINKFDLVVNYCPKEMMLEYDKFDKIEN